MLSNLLPKLNDHDYRLLMDCLTQYLFYLQTLPSMHEENEKDLAALMDFIREETIVINNFKGE